MCECVDKINEKLKQHNSTLSMMYILRGNKLVGVPALETEKINKRQREKMGAIPSHCPFCGTKYEETDE